MGWRYRKSYNFGGFRINLSKSGIGYSFGMPGMRYTKMANGRERITYSIPGTGISHISETSPNNNKPNNNNQNNERALLGNPDVLYLANADIEDYQDVQYDEFLSNIRKCKARNDNYNIIMIILFLIGLFIHILLIVPLIMFIYKKCNTKQFKIDADYLFDDFYQDYYTNLNNLLDEIAKNDKVWAIETKIKVNGQDKKYNAGASSTITRQAVKLNKKVPPYLKANIAPYYLTFKNNKFYFLPDRILLETPKEIKDIKFSALKFEFDHQRFIEDETVAKDALIVDKTWQYINKDGSPDRRFKYNREIPICLYSTIHCHSNSGLDIILYLSNNDSASNVETMYNDLVKKRLNFAFSL